MSDPLYGGEGAAMVVADELLHVLQQESLGLVALQNGGHVEEQRAAHIVEAFHLAHDGECLTGESGQQHVELLGNEPLHALLGDVAKRHLAEVGEVGLLGIGIPL